MSVLKRILEYEYEEIEYAAVQTDTTILEMFSVMGKSDDARESINYLTSWIYEQSKAMLEVLEEMHKPSDAQLKAEEAEYMEDMKADEEWLRRKEEYDNSH